METRTALTLGLIGAVVVVAIALIASSARRLDSAEVGLSYDPNQRKLGSTAKREGLHFGAPGYKFIKFSSVFETVAYTKVTCLNKDGLVIDLDVQFQYRVNANHLKKVVWEFRDADNYETIVRSIGLYAIHDGCSEYNTSQTVNERAEFQSRIQEIMEQRLGNVSAVVTDLQVSNIGRPLKYEEALTAKEGAKESITTAILEQPRQIIEVKTKLRQAETQAEITVDLAKSKAKIALTKAKAQAQAILEAYKTEALIYSSIMKQQNLTIEGLLSYISVRVIGETDNTVYTGLDPPAKTKYTH